MGRAAISLEALSISSYVVSKAHQVLREQPGGIHDQEAHSLSSAVVAGLSDLGLRRGSCPAPPQEGPFHRTGTDDGCLLSIWPKRACNRAWINMEPHSGLHAPIKAGRKPASGLADTDRMCSASGLA